MWRGRNHVVTMVKRALKAEFVDGLHIVTKLLHGRKVSCPACRREVPKAYIRRHAFPCPNCGTPLRIPRLSRVWLTPPLLACGVSLAILIPYALGLRENALFIATIILLAPCGISTGFVLGAALWYFFPRLERDPAWQEGEILHVTPQRGPWKGKERL